MASMEVLLASAIEWSVRVTGQNTTVTASKASPGQPGFRHYVFGTTVSADGAPSTSGIEVQLQKDSGSVVLDGYLLPQSQFIPIVLNYLNHPFEGSDNGDVSLVIPALGNGVNAVAVLKGTTRSKG
jgi:hypothetical protein